MPAEKGFLKRVMYNPAQSLPRESTNSQAGTPQFVRASSQSMNSVRNRSAGELYRRLLLQVLPYWRVFALSAVCLTLLAAVEPALPALFQPLLDGTFNEPDPVRRLRVPALVVLMFFLRGAFSYISDVSLAKVAQRVVMDLRRNMFARLVMMPSQFYDNHNFGEIISKLTYDVAQVSQAATRCFTVIVKDTLASVVLMGYMIYVNWSLSLFIIVVMPIVAIIVRIVSRRLRRMSKKVQETMGEMTQIAQEAIEGNRAVKVFGGQSYEAQRFEAVSNRNRQFNMKVVITSAANVPIIQLLLSIALSAIVYFAASQSAASAITVGSFVAMSGATLLLLAAVRRLTGINEHLQRGLAAANSVFDFIDAPTEPDDGSQTIAQVHGKIEIRDVRLSYGQGHAPALDGVGIQIAPGETVALVGASGSGKSSLINLIPRFYQPTAGRILIDDIDIASITLDSLRQHIALVSQEVVLFNDTIRNNIAYGAMRNASEAEIINAAEAAHVMEFVDKLPNGLDTLIGEQGARLSGGQRQRLAIARAILKNAPILIMDEATSSLDTASERHIQEALDSLRKGRTCIIIAHRLSTIENADRIIVLHQGRVVETGTHETLIARPGVYANLHKIQFGATELR